MLTRQLRELEAAGLIHREVYAEVPPRVEYSLTALGRSLEPVIRSLWTWGNTYLEVRRTAPRSLNGFGATHKLGDAARALPTSSCRQTAPQVCVSMNMLFPLSRKAARATGDLILHTAQHLRVVTISNVGGTPPPRALPKFKNKIWNFNMLQGRWRSLGKNDKPMNSMP
jgi:hypothetical protein